MPNFRPMSWCCVAIAALLGPIPDQADAQTRIENVATLHFIVGAGEQTLDSNKTALDVVRIKKPTRFSFRHIPAGYQFPGMKCTTTPPITFTPGEVSAEDLVTAAPLASLDIADPLLVVLEAEAENHDPAVREQVSIHADTDTRKGAFFLMETGVNTGVFAGGLPGEAAPDQNMACSIMREDGKHLFLRFDEGEFSLGSDSTVLIDPQGYVFDTATGEVVNGATVSVVVDQTGELAKVFADDGVSGYPSTVISGGQATDSRGRVYKFEPGRFRFPLMPAGNYRLVVTPPAGYRAPSTASAESLAHFRGPQGAYQIIDASYGRVFTLNSPEPLYVDIPIDTGSVGQALLLEKTASVRVAEPGDVIQYRLRITNRDTEGSARLPVVADTLPVGLRYRRGSTRGSAEPLVANNGRDMRFSAADIGPGAIREITYSVEVTPGAPVGEALNRARATSGGNTSDEASASVRLRPLMFSDAMTLIGRVTEGDCRNPSAKRKGVGGIRLMLEDGTFVVTDSDGLYHVEGLKAGTHVVQMDTRSIPATHEAVACDDDTQQAGTAISRFVTADGGALKRVDFQLRLTGKAADTTRDALPVTIATDADAAGNRPDWLKDQAPGIDWLFPIVDHNPRAPALRVVIKHMPGQRVALRVNGAPVDPLTFDGSDSDADRGVAISTWTGIALGERDNILDATVMDASGAVAATLHRVVHYANQAVQATYVPEKSRLVADGLTRPLIAVRLADRDGKPVRAGTLIPFSIDSPYAAAQDAELQSARQLAGRERAAATARVVGDEGIAFIALEPTTQAGAARVSITLEDKGEARTSTFSTWLTASVRDWMVVGFGEGTVGFDRLSKARGLPRGERNKVVTDGQLSLYAKGRVKGSWLLTVAYDSDRKYDPDRGLLGTIDPDRYYTVYGDGSRQGYDAATRRKLYLRLERREFYALFGDFETGLVDTRLTRYSRTMNGVKAEYQGGHLIFSGFAANTDQLYARDEIQGNGLSGPYRLSGRNIVPNSDKIRIETRDRFRSEKIVSSKELTRHIDYDIDALNGTLRFRAPILSRDADLNPNFIVADYETDGRSKNLAAGGRVAARFAKGKVEVGASVLRDETAGTATVGGVDVKAQVTANTLVRAEAASGGKGGVKSGKAYLGEVEHHGKVADVLTYVRQQESDFGLGQQNAGEAGTRKFGFDGRLRLSPKLSVSASAWHQDNLDDAGKRTAGEARVEYLRDTGMLFAGVQFASDTGIGSTKRDSRLISLGGTQRAFGQKVELSGQTQFALGGEKDSVDFPVRHKLGASWQVVEGIRLIAEHEIADGARFKAHGTRVGFDVAPWTGAKLLGTLNQEAIGEAGPRSFAQYGLSQSLPIGKHWTVDATFDASSTVRGAIPTGDVVNPLHPVASGGSLGQGQLNGDYQAVTLGGTYRADRWSWNGRAELRRGSESDYWGLTSNILRTLGQGKTIAAGLRYSELQDKDRSKATFGSATVAVAFRPLDSRWSVLERFELRHDRADSGIAGDNVLGVPAFAAGGQQSTRAVNNLAVNYRTGNEGDRHTLEASVYYGAKYVSGRFADEKYDGFIDVIGLEVRQDIGRRFDVGVNGSMQHSWSSHTKAFSAGPTLGFSPGNNVWLVAGYNVSGYRDRDFEDARYTRQGPYLTLRLKFDQLSLGQAARGIGGRVR